jgi:hypothetical protein
MEVNELEILANQFEPDATDINVDSTTTNTSTVDVPVDLPVDTPPVDKPSDDKNTDEDTDILFKEEVQKFKDLVGVEEDIEDFSVETISKILNGKIESVKKQYENLESDPEIKALIEHKQKGGTLESFIQTPITFNKALFDVNNDNHVETVFTTYWKNIKGLDAEDVELALSALKANPDTLKVKFTKVLDEIESISLKEVETYNAKIEAERKQKEEVSKSFLTVIDKGEIGTIKLPPAEKTKFKEYLNSDTYNANWDALEKDPIKMAILEYFVYNNLNIQTEVKQNVQKRNVINLIQTDKRKVNDVVDADIDEVLQQLKQIG